MIPLLLTASSFLNFIFYIYAIGFAFALGLEQVLKFRPLSVDKSMNERNMFIVQTNRKYLWRQVWVVNLNWFCLLYTSPSPRDATLSRMPSSA